MKISMNSLPLPEALALDLEAGRRPLSSSQKARLGAILQCVERPFPELYDLGAIEGANRLWCSEYVQFYLGNVSAAHSPGNIDPALALIIGQAEPDGPIALDYRVSPPRVVYLGTVGDESLWIELSANYECLISQISPPPPDSPPSTPRG